jgi:hypothetical protein
MIGGSAAPSGMKNGVEYGVESGAMACLRAAIDPVPTLPHPAGAAKCFASAGKTAHSNLSPLM